MTETRIRKAKDRMMSIEFSEEELILLQSAAMAVAATLPRRSRDRRILFQADLAIERRRAADRDGLPELWKIEKPRKPYSRHDTHKRRARS